MLTPHAARTWCRRCTAPRLPAPRRAHVDSVLAFRGRSTDSTLAMHRHTRRQRHHTQVCAGRHRGPRGDPSPLLSGDFPYSRVGALRHPHHGCNQSAVLCASPSRPARTTHRALRARRRNDGRDEPRYRLDHVIVEVTTSPPVTSKRPKGPRRRFCSSSLAPSSL